MVDPAAHKHQFSTADIAGLKPPKYGQPEEPLPQPKDRVLESSSMQMLQSPVKVFHNCKAL